MSLVTMDYEYTQLGPFKVPRIFNGLWQLSSNAWGVTDAERTREEMTRYADSGLYAFDMADQYGPAESIFGEFRASYSHPKSLVAATKWCVFENITPTRDVVEAAVRARLTALQAPWVDLLQTHWGDYTGDYVGAHRELAALQKEGLIAALGLCNMDCQRTEEICTALGPGFSLIDQRPLAGMVDVCAKHDLKLLTYGTLCGGFLSDKYLGASEPDFKSVSLTPSQRKYLDVITSIWGSWELFQDLLRTLRTIGDRHFGASVASIATRWVLDQPSVGAVLVGTRLGVSSHLEDAHKIFALRLTDEDRADINAVLARSKGQEMMTRIGDCGAEYRKRIEGVKYYSPEGHA
ncbi:unnamed protein product [Rhizoctonia solani]|uniref:NADP-dependent oxidoreductase domain-containing protein n=1 Tax=Rhizoctonia solani TaxID=456999 RepID=A0A8H3CF26_9AGAM|nr:unnamed protein product [Rhizoctonia solani]